MSAHCQLTGRKPGFVKVIDRDGIEAVVARPRRQKVNV
jgi:ribosomal protein L28